MASGAKSKASKTAVWVILGLLIVGLAGFGATNFGGSVSAVGTVGDTEIDLNRYVRELNNELRALSAQTGRQVTLSEMQQIGIDRAVLQRLVATVALEDEAARLGISVGDAQVRDQVLNISAFQGIDGKFDREAYRFTLEQSGLTEAAFEDSLRAEVARTMLQGAVGAGVGAPAPIVDTLFDYDAERRDISWLEIGPGTLDEGLPEPNDAGLRAHYDANSDAYMLPETRRITFAWLTPEMLIDTVEVDEAALRELYETRSDEFNRPERRLVERLVFGTADEAAAARARLDFGEASFEALVAERNLDLADIDLGDMTRADLGAAGAAVFALDAPGIVGPVETDLGPALIRMNAILSAQVTSFEEARETLTEELARDRARRVIADRIDTVDDLLAGGATLEELPDETDMQLGRIDWTVDVSEGIAAYPAFRDAARGAREGDFPEVMEFEDGGIFALRLDEVVAPRLEPFEDARDRVAEDWRRAETLTRLTEKAETLAAEVATGADMAATGLAVQSETGLTRQSLFPGVPPELVLRAFALEEGEAEAVTGRDAAYVLRLDAIAPPDLSDPDIAARRDRLAQATAQAIGQDLLQAFFAAVERKAGITLNRPAINAVHAQFP